MIKEAVTMVLTRKSVLKVATIGLFALFFVNCSGESELDTDSEELCQCIKDSGQEWESLCAELKNELAEKYKKDKKSWETIEKKMESCLPNSN